MTQVETLRSDENLTAVNNGQESEKGLTEPTEDLLDGAKNWQHALQIKQERLKEEREARELAEARLKEIEDAEKQRTMDNLSESDKWKVIAKEEEKKRGALELKLVVKDTLSGKKLPQPIVDLLTETPWAIPQVARELGDNFTWDEAIASVKRHLPSYVESLVVGEIPSEESLKKVDSERSVDTTIIKDHIYTRSEVEAIGKDGPMWEKHREAILKQMNKYGGVLPE